VQPAAPPVQPAPVKINAKKLDIKPGFAPAGSVKKEEKKPEPAPEPAPAPEPEPPAPPRGEVDEEPAPINRFAPLKASQKKEQEHPMVCMLTWP
jgi:hypothetical protein